MDVPQSHHSRAFGQLRHESRADLTPFNRFLGISRVGVLLSLEKAKNICQKYEFQLTPPNPTDSTCWKTT